MTVPVLVIIVIAFALVFDFVNGFHDSANSVATIVSTRVLTPLQAVAWAAIFNFVSAFTFGTKVAGTVGKGFVDTHVVAVWVIFAGVLGAILWDFLTWLVGLPTSSSSITSARLKNTRGRGGRPAGALSHPARRTAGPLLFVT
jgi:PiT family inorganic phosphate transporter